MVKVSIVKCSDYVPERVTEAVALAVKLIGGVGDASGRSVLVKPNLLSARDPEAAVTTHPVVTEAVVRLWADAGAKVHLGDSPPLAGEKPSGYERLLRITGMQGVADRTGAEIVRFEDGTVNIEYPDGKYYHRFDIAQAVAEADIIVNVPKLKSHGLTTMTAAVKNMFGCVPGKKKAIFHLQAGEDCVTFSQMLIDLLGCVPPAVSVMDAITIMQGDGPVDGETRRLGLVMASSDPIALDGVAALVLGIDPMTIETCRIGGFDLGQVEVVGERVEDVAIDDFMLPKSTNFWLRVPAPLRKLLKNQLIPYPNITKKCRNCGACVEGCPVGTISASGKRPQIELQGCIRCYCCREVCEFSAIDVKVGRLSSAIRLVRDVRRAILKARDRT